MHLPAIMDGGPHQVIPAGTLWQPYYNQNQAATLWYHPHLQRNYTRTITKGVGGFIIKKTQRSAVLQFLERMVDDIPLAISSRRF
jgi:FtsP/CotA-like multicopper oxidase with cupredoxin domain